MRLQLVLIALSAALTHGLPADARTSPQAPSVRYVDPGRTPATGLAADGAPRLTKQHLDSWLDGLLPYALAQADIASVSPPT